MQYFYNRVIDFLNVLRYHITMQGEVNNLQEQYKGFLIQESENVYYIRDASGKITMKTETEKAAREWIDEHK